MNRTMRNMGRLAAVVAVALVLTGLGATVAGAKVTKYPDPGSKAQFQWECELLGGTFTDTGDGNTWCQTPDGKQILCDANGRDCHHISRPNPQGPDGPLDLGGGSVVGDSPANAQEGANSPTVASPDAPGASPSVTAADDDHEPKAKAKSKKGKKHGRGGKVRK
jgi:hypothetical protein